MMLLIAEDKTKIFNNTNLYTFISLSCKVYKKNLQIDY